MHFKELSHHYLLSGEQELPAAGQRRREAWRGKSGLLKVTRPLRSDLGLSSRPQSPSF